MSKFIYRVEKICHLPTAEDKITIIKEVTNKDLHHARITATNFFLEAVQDLKGKYSPPGFNDYEPRKGKGYNYQLLMINTDDNTSLPVESTMENSIIDVLVNKLKERKIFEQLGLNFIEV